MRFPCVRPVAIIASAACSVLTLTFLAPAAGGSTSPTPTPNATTGTPLPSPITPSPIPTLPSATVLPQFGPEIDNYAAASPMTSCHPVATEGARTVMHLMRTYAKRGVNITRDCRIGAASEHKEGRAVDWMANARNGTQRKQADRLMTWLLADDEHGNTHAMARRLGVHYIIWNGRWWRSNLPQLGWVEFGTCLTKRTDRTSDNYCHRDHVHITLSWDGAQQRTSYYGVTPATTPGCIMSRGTITAPTEFLTEPEIPIEPLRILDTQQGIGVPNICRLTQRAFSTERRELRFPIPMSNASAVRLQITVVDPNAPTAIYVFPAGTAQPAAPAMKTDLTGGTATVLVGIGAGNSVAIATNSGAHHVTVDLIGYVSTVPVFSPAP
jgi:hypothetical protein